MQKFHFSGFQRHVTLLHADPLVGEITIRQRQVFHEAERFRRSPRNASKPKTRLKLKLGVTWIR
jgi:hypothetical protein